MEYCFFFFVAFLNNFRGPEGNNIVMKPSVEVFTCTPTKEHYDDHCIHLCIFYINLCNMFKKGIHIVYITFCNVCAKKIARRLSAAAYNGFAHILHWNIVQTFWMCLPWLALSQTRTGWILPEIGDSVQSILYCPS